MPTIAKFSLVLVFGLAMLTILAACSPLQTINALTPGNTYQRHADLAYGADPRHRLDVYSPLSAAGQAPVVIFFYGGSWNSGERKDYEFVGEALASRGMVAVLADYRLYPQVRYPEFLEDGAMAVAWIRREARRFGGDPKRMFLMGHSAGAYNAAMLALDPRWLAPYAMTPQDLRGWIGLAGPYDFIPIVNPAVRPVFFHPATPPESQPINHVSAAAPPALLVAAKKDELVNPERNTGGLARQLRAVGVPVDEFYFDRAGHASLVAMLSRPLRGLVPVLELTERFVMSDGGRTSSPAEPAVPASPPAKSSP
ncbi:alpha/beta hydrolase [soil metagenome]